MTDLFTFFSRVQFSPLRPVKHPMHSIGENDILTRSERRFSLEHEFDLRFDFAIASLDDQDNDRTFLFVN